MIQDSNKIQPSTILIVGGGIAGLTLALLLEKNGHEVELIEREAEWNSLGGGITLTLNGMKLLHEIGLGEKIEARGLPISQIKITDAHNHLLSCFNLEKYSNTYARTITIHRTELHEILKSHLQKTKVHLNVTFNSIEKSAEKVNVNFSDGRTGKYDMVVGCDGIYSSVRKAIFKNVKIHYAGYACWRFVCDAKMIPYPVDTLTEMWGKGRRFGIVPLSRNRIHCFASINTIDPTKYESVSIEKFKSLFSGFTGIVPILLDQLNESEKLLFNRLEDVIVDNWVKENVVLIGDAAHGMTPNLTQGASLAIEDAVCLSNAINENRTLEKGLLDFFSKRKKRVISIQRKSALLGKVGQLQSPVLAGLRNYCWKNLPDRWIQKDFENLLIEKQK